MKDNLFIIIVIIFIITHVIRLLYEVLKHKKIITPNKLSFIIIFINMLALWISWFTLCSLDKSKIYIPTVIKFTGLVLSLAGVLLFITALLTIKSLEDYSGDLITTGIYSKISHPMYLGFIFWLIGFPVYNGAVFSFFLGLLFTINILYWKYLEELELQKRFSGYKEYRRRTLF